LRVLCRRSTSRQAAAAERSDWLRQRGYVRLLVLLIMLPELPKLLLLRDAGDVTAAAVDV
jgi:hypothetical protein